MIVTKNSSFVTPSEPTPTDPLLLSDCDQSKVWSLAPTIYVYPPHNTSLFSFPRVVETLKVSLGRVLVPFYPLAGRLRWIGGGRLELDCNAVGAEFVAAESDSTLEGFGGFEPTDKIKPLLPDIDYDLPLEKLPAMSVRVTRFACGGITVGLAISHALIDGKAAMHFIKSWTKLARGEALDDSDVPFHDRSVFCCKDMYSSLDMPVEWKPLPVLVGRSDAEEEREKETTVGEFKLTREQIQTLRCQANSVVKVQHQQSAWPTKMSHIEKPIDPAAKPVHQASTWSTKISLIKKPIDPVVKPVHQEGTWPTKISHTKNPIDPVVKPVRQESTWPTEMSHIENPIDPVVEPVPQESTWPMETSHIEKPTNPVVESVHQKSTWPMKKSPIEKPTYPVVEPIHQKTTWLTEKSHIEKPIDTIIEPVHQEITWPTKTIQNERPYTTFEAVSAHIWRSACKARGHEYDQPTVHMLTVDCRDRVNPPLPKGYFGNAVLRTITDPNTVSGDLASKPLSYAAGKIRESIHKFTSSYVESTLGFIRRQEDVSWTRASFHMAGSKLGLFLGNPNMIVASWIGLPTQDADFGWGKPSYMGPGALSSDGKCFIVPDCDEDGSLIVILRLQTAHMGVFGKYFYEGI